MGHGAGQDVMNNTVVLYPGTDRALEAGQSYTHFTAGGAMANVTGGGGGWGDPLDRDTGLVAKEVRQGLVTPEGARRYGVVIDCEQVDVRATEELRKLLREKRHGPMPVFNFGPDIETLRANCEAETGLPPPRQPQWNRRAQV